LLSEGGLVCDPVRDIREIEGLRVHVARIHAARA
jgi:hypothetical protein